MTEMALPVAGVPELEIEHDIIDPAALLAIRHAAMALLSEMKPDRGEGPAALCEAVWPAYMIKDTRPHPRLVLVPLSRLGGSPGFSGSHVMIGYFIDGSAESPIHPSRAMVLKIGRSATPDQDVLCIENSNARLLRPFVGYHRESFAIPLWLHEIHGFRLLWSPFASGEWTLQSVRGADSTRLNLRVRDLWGLMGDLPVDSSNGDEVLTTIERIYRLLTPLHRRGGTAKRENRQLVQEYKWYLRDFENSWGKDWAGVWAGESEPNVVEFGTQYKNPLWVLDQLKSLGCGLYCGAIHGDLHPKNIVFSENSVPQIIDFGWTSDDSHIAKDFVLLECNLRFVLLRPDVSSLDLTTFTSWLKYDQAPPAFVHPHLSAMAKAITLLRREAQSMFPPDTDWNIEYIVPLFLVALGLLKHLKNYRNQIAARLTVLELATLIAKEVLTR